MDVTLRLDLSQLDFSFTAPPLLIGGKAMEYYGLRPAGADIDLVITAEDYARLARQYPDHLKDLWGDLGVCVYEFEIWKSICLFDYVFLSERALEQEGYRIISLEKLLFLKALGMKVPKYHHDLELIVARVFQERDEKIHHPVTQPAQMETSEIKARLVERPAFGVIGKKTWIGGQDNDLFGRFWAQCRQDGVLARLERLGGSQPGSQTQGRTLGISRVEQDPARREFYYMIAIETPEGGASAVPDELESYQVLASHWAVFECRGQVPESIVKSEIYAFTQWLPASGFVHAPAPEMEVYPNRSGDYCEFWLPIQQPRLLTREQI